MLEALTIRCISDLWFYGASQARTVTPFLGVFNMKAKVQKKIYVENLLSRAFVSVLLIPATFFKMVILIS